MNIPALKTESSTDAQTVKPEVKTDNAGGATKGNPIKSKFKTSSRVSHKQGYDYEGESSDIGLILGLPSEKLGNKVIFSTFVDKMKNYVLTNFEEVQRRKGHDVNLGVLDGPKSIN